MTAAFGLERLSAASPLWSRLLLYLARRARRAGRPDRVRALLGRLDPARMFDPEQLGDLIALSTAPETATLWEAACQRLLTLGADTPARATAEAVVGNGLVRLAFLSDRGIGDRGMRWRMAAEIGLLPLSQPLRDGDKRLRYATFLAIGPISAELFRALVDSDPDLSLAVARRLAGYAEAGRVDRADLLTLLARVRDHSAARARTALAVDELGGSKDPAWIRELRLAFDRRALTPAEVADAEDRSCAGSDNPILRAVRRRSREDGIRGLRYVMRLATWFVGQGFLLEAARLVEPYSGESQRAARLWAQAMSRFRPAEERLQVWRQVAAVHDSPQVWPHIANGIADLLDYDGGWSILTRLAEQYPDEPGIVRNLILFKERIGALSESRAIAERLATEFPEDTRIANDVKRLSFEAGLVPPQAEPPPPLVDGEGVPYHRFLAMQHLIDGQNAQSASIWREVAEFSGTADDAHAHLNALFATGAFDEAAALAATLARRFAGDHRFRLKLGQVAERLGDQEEALRQYGEALRLFPDDQGVRAGIARALIGLARYDEARDWLALCRSGEDDALWTEALAAFLAYRRGDDAGVRDGLAYLYAVGSAYLAAHRAARANDPAGVLVSKKKALRHPAPDHPRSAALFDAFIDRVRSARDVVLVGNSPAIVGSGLGPRIDAADCVIRLNDFRIAGFEADVGTRTDYWHSSANRQARPHLESVRHATAIVTQPHPVHVPEIESFVRGRLRLDLDSASVCYLPPWIHRLSTTLAYPKPTTGFRMILILEFLLQVRFTAIGFDFFATEEMHYFDRGQQHLQVGEVHAIDFERDFVEMLHKAGRGLRLV